MKGFILVLFFSFISITKADTSPSAADVAHGFITTQIEIDINAPIEKVFDFTVAEDVLPKVLFRSGVIPGVVGTTILKNPSWDAPGAQRIVHLDDGNTAVEEVTGFDRPGYFSYQSSNYSGFFGRFVDLAKGEWWFEERDGKTHVIWKYSFKAKNGFGYFLLSRCLVPHSFHRYMQKALNRIKGFVEG